MTSSSLLMDRIVIRICCALTISATLVSGIFLPGYNDKRQLHVCADGMRDLSCTLGEFLWVDSVVIGYSRSDSRGCTTAPSDCMRNLTNSDYWRATSYQVYSGVRVPVEKVTCEDSTLQSANYVLITYSCVSISCGERTSIEDQVGNVLLHHCSPGWRQFRVSPNSVADTIPGTTSLHVRFIKDHTNDYPPRMTKLWYGVEATAPLQVTCGPTGSNTTPMPATPTPASSTPASNLSEAIIIIVCAVCGTLVLVVIAGVVACVLVNRNRSLNTQVTTPTLSPPPTPSASMGPGSVNSAYVDEVDDYLTNSHGYRPPIAPPNEYVHDI